MEAAGNPALIDSGLIAAAQRVEHYEMSAYGTARTFAEALGHAEVAELLQETLDEEEQADRTLTEISVEELLPEACQTEEGEAESDDASPQSTRPSSKKRRPVGSRSR
jgi:ferritin-like metal-binding protein YciE